MLNADKLYQVTVEVRNKRHEKGLKRQNAKWKSAATDFVLKLEPVLTALAADGKSSGAVSFVDQSDEQLDENYEVKPYGFWAAVQSELEAAGFISWFKPGSKLTLWVSWDQSY